MPPPEIVFTHPDQEKSNISLKTESLGTITVTAEQLNLLQQLQAALNRQFSYAAADRDKMVCRFKRLTGSFIRQTLVCGTNHEWERRQDQNQVAWTQVHMSMGGKRGSAAAAAEIQALQEIRGTNMAFQMDLRDPLQMRQLLKAAVRKKEQTASTGGSGN